MVTWHCRRRHLMMVVAWPEARRHRRGLCYRGSTGSMSSLGRDGGVMLQWWYGPGHITVIVVACATVAAQAPCRRWAVMVASCCSGGMAQGTSPSSSSRHVINREGPGVRWWARPECHRHCRRCYHVVVVVWPGARRCHKAGDLGQGVSSPHHCTKATWGASSSHLSYCCLVGIGCGSGAHRQYQ